MILKRPYAFLIKRFKLIHLILTVFSVYLIIKSNAIYSFFNLYVKNNYSALITQNFKSNFVSFSVILVTILLICIILAIILLLSFKKKKQKIYTLYLIYYVVFLIMLFVYSSIFTGLENGVISADLSRLIRDISLLVYLPQIAFIIITAVRALGFNVKQFEFKKDLKDLSIDELDSEEVEISVELETYKAKRITRKFFREFKYYLKENAFIIILLSIILTFVVVKVIIDNISFDSKSVYNENITFVSKGLKLSVLESMVSELDLSGKKISDGKTYIILKLELENISNDEIKMDPHIFKLYDSKNHISINPSIEKSDLFSDLGISLNREMIKMKEKNIFVLPYEIESKNKTNKHELRIFKEITVKNNISYPIHNRVLLKPKELEFEQLENKYRLDDELAFVDSHVGNSSITISNYEITKNYIYDYQHCIGKNCETKKDMIYITPIGTDYDKTILILDAKLEIDTDTEYYKSNKTKESFIQNFVTVQYQIGEEKYFSRVESIKANKVEDKLLLKVHEDISLAEKIKLIFSIRNKIYTYDLKVD